VENRFQSLPFKCNLQRYTTLAKLLLRLGESLLAQGLPRYPQAAVGLCTLNQVDT
jgi:hypothetical protein